MNDYVIYQSSYIQENVVPIIDHIQQAHESFERIFPGRDSTWTYNKYNIFTLAAPSTYFFYIYKELRNLIVKHLGTDNEIWLQAWINYMDYNQIDRLDWHNHDFNYHGYICIDPKNTTTDFTEYKIENKIGQIYFGPGYRKHKVIANENYEGTRITIGFDLVINPSSKYVKYVDQPWNDMSFIPLI